MVIEIQLDGRRALVTGAATGLGLAIARTLGEAGARVAVNDLTPERVDRAVAALREAGIEALGVAADVRDAPAVEAMVGEVERRFGGLDILVANAGIYPNTPFLDLTEAEWDRVMDTNVKGVFLTGQAAARAMVRGGRGGQIVTLGSGAANAAYIGWAHYCASKAAVSMLTRAMALELGPHGIRVNAILPGYIDVEEGGADLDPAYKAAMRSAIPRGRPGTPDDIARAVLLLLSPLADYVNGALLSVDGGSSAGRLSLRPRSAP